MQPPEDADLSPYAGLSRKIRGGKSAAAVEYESRPPALSVMRRRDGPEVHVRGIRGLVIGVANSFRSALDTYPFGVELDGETVGELLSGATLHLEVAPGEHRLRITTPISKSRAKSLQIENGQRLKYSCLSTMTGISLIRDD